MHGSSSVPQEWLKIIRDFGGDIKETYGVPVEEIVEGIRHGVRKVNIDTDIRLAMTGAMRKLMAEKPEEFDPVRFLKLQPQLRVIFARHVLMHSVARVAHQKSNLSCSKRWHNVTPKAS